MLLVIEFGVDADIIDVPKIVIENLKQYQEQFIKWLFDKSVDHAYWWYVDGEKFGCDYRSNAFLEWLNTNLLNELEEKAITVSTFVTVYDKSLPSLYF